MNIFKKKMTLYHRIPSINHADHIKSQLMNNKKVKETINLIMRVNDNKIIKNSSDLIKSHLKLMILFKEKSEKNILKIQSTNILLLSLCKHPIMESTMLMQEEDLILLLFLHHRLHHIISMHRIRIRNRYIL